VGSTLYCERLGRQVPVGGLHDAPIPWPYAGVKGPRALILCGDLVRAVRCESVVAVCHWWRVHRNTVSRWRRLLGVEQRTEGTARLQRLAIAARMADGPPENTTAGCRTPCERERRRQQFAARPVKPDEYRFPRWQPAEDALLGAVPEAEAVRRLGRSLHAVRHRKRRLRQAAGNVNATT